MADYSISAEIKADTGSFTKGILSIMMAMSSLTGTG